MLTTFDVGDCLLLRDLPASCCAGIDTTDIRDALVRAAAIGFVDTINS